jgi:hypothetical protein
MDRDEFPTPMDYEPYDTRLRCLMLIIELMNEVVSLF